MKTITRSEVIFYSVLAAAFIIGVVLIVVFANVDKLA